MASKHLKSAEIQQALTSLPGWSHDGDTLAKCYKFGSFREAISFMVRAGFEAEDMGHHPDWSNVYDRVDVRLNTHEAGGKVTAKDVELAQRFEKISWVK